MTTKIDPRQVLSYLNELGYTNITAQQLKDFIKDLKKVIKYESTYEEASKEFNSPGFYNNIQPEMSMSSESDKENRILPTEVSSQFSDDNEKVPIQPVKKHIVLQVINKKNPNSIQHEHCIHVNENSANSQNGTTHNENSTTEATIKTLNPESLSKISSFKESSKNRKTKVTLIRPKVSKPSFNKCDPVALYHFYQSEWRTANIPGENSRDDLRWAIRERMLNGPKVQLKSSKTSIHKSAWSNT